MKGVLSSVMDVLFPKVCGVCGTSLGEGQESVCSGCRLSLRPTRFYVAGDKVGMTDRFPSDIPLQWAWAMYDYRRDSVLAHLVHDFKYRHMPGIARNLGREMGHYMSRCRLDESIDVILPVPMHQCKRIKRGYNQAEVLACGISDSIGVEVRRNLRAVRRHATQTMKSVEERYENLRGVFAVKHPEELDGKHILLVDDICTTGSTLTFAARALLAACSADDGRPRIRLSIATLGCTRD